MKKWKSYPVIAAVGVAIGLAAGQGLAQSSGRSAVASGAATPNSPRTLYMDRQAIWQNSKVGKDIQRQVDAYMEGEQRLFGAQGDALRKEYLTLQQPSLAPNVRDQKMSALRARQTDFQQKVRSYEMMIRYGEVKARDQLQLALTPILDDIMRERGADLVVNKGAVVQGAAGLDITQSVMQRLDRKLSRLKVELVKPPANATGD